MMISKAHFIFFQSGQILKSAAYVASMKEWADDAGLMGNGLKINLLMKFISQ
ncbi:hypothetical protein ACI48U_001936 [Listeria monocytogenes]